MKKRGRTRRIVAWIAAVVMTVAIAAGALCEESEEMKRYGFDKSVKKYAGAMISNLALLYELAGDEMFNADLITATNAYAMIYLGATEAMSAELRLSAVGGMVSSAKNGGMFSEMDRTVESGLWRIYGMYIDAYRNWLDGELTDAEYCGKVIRSLNTMVKTAEDAGTESGK